MKLLDLKLKRTKGQTKTVCPACSHTRSKQSDPCLSVNLDTGLYRCHHCGVNGILDDYKTKTNDNYTTPPQETVSLSGAGFDFFRQRGIPLEIVKENRITSSPKQPEQWVAFNYYENGVIVNIKYRHVSEKRFMQSPGGKQIFYGDTKGHKTLVITEGEIDKLSFDLAGIPSVSVPMGAPNENDASADGKLKCLAYAEDDLTQTEDVVLACDNDPNGRRLTEELARRIGFSKCRKVEYPEGCKDANDVLQKHGVEALIAMVDNAKSYPLVGVSNIEDYNDEINTLYEKGLPEGYPIGLPNFDKLFKFQVGYLVTITGIPSHGKSTFLEFVIMQLIIRYGFKFGVFSPEHYPPEYFISRLLRMYTGLPMFGEGKMSKETLDKAKAFLNEHIYIIHANGDHTLDNIHEITKQLVFRHGIHGLVIDPWTDIEHDLGGENETLYTRKALAKIKNFNRMHGITTFLVAHPTKMNKKEDGSYYVPTMYSISGSANFYNRTDFGWSVYRHEDNTVTVYSQKVKFEGLLGEKGYADFFFDKSSSRYMEAGSRKEKAIDGEINFEP